jgi:hypothetical protein
MKTDVKLLSELDADLAFAETSLNKLVEKYRDGGEGRIAWEITQAMRCLNEAKVLAQHYISERE